MSERHDNQAEEEGGIGLGDILGALRRRVWLIVLLATLGGSIAATIALLLPNQYEAVATIQIDPRKKTILSLDAVLPDIAGDTPTIESQVELIRARDLALKVIDVLGLRADPEFGGSPGFAARMPAATAGDREEATAQRIKGPEAAAIGAGSPERDHVAAEFADRLKAVRVRNSLVVEISFRSQDPVKAARIANTLAEVYIRDQIDMKIKATGLAAELLEPKLDGLRGKVAEAEQRVARFKAENGIFDAEGQLLSEKKLARLMEQTVAARNASAEARAKYDQVQLLLADGSGRSTTAVLLSETIRMQKDQLVKATKRLAELETRYGSRHPEIARAAAEVADVESQIARETSQILANVKTELAVANERERMLEASLSDLKAQQSVSKEVTVKLRELERDADTSRRVLEAFLARYKQTVETQDLHLPDARIVERATVPFSPVAPKRKQIALIGLVGGLGAGLGLALLIELLRTGIARREEAEALLGVPLLASVPMLKRESDGLADPMSALRVVLARPHGAFARTMAELRDGLERRRNDAAPRIVLVASSLPNEGTTVIAANLALSLQLAGRRTLLIDGDLRRSKLSQHLDLEQAPGIADAIGLGEDFERVILRDTVSGLAVIPAGDIGRFPLSPQEALEAPGFTQRLTRLKTHFDAIVVDAPPLVPVVDTRILAGYADEIVLVTAWRRTPKDIVRRAHRLLGGNAALVAGLVLNLVDPKAIARPSKTTRRSARSEGRPARRAA